MKKLLIVAALAAIATGCTSPAKMRDIELKGMYVNGYSEVLAIGSGRLTSIPGEREALAAHYSEDTAWLQPNIKTHSLDIFLVGTNSVENSTEIIKSICEAFKEVAPSIAKTNADVAKNVSTVTPLGAVQAGGEVRKATALAKAAKEKLGSDSVKVESDSVKVGTDATAGTDGTCPSGACTTGACVDGACEAK